MVLSCDGRKGWINRLTVEPDYRRRGIARVLIERSEAVLRDHGVRTFCAPIEEDNKASKSLFGECGYVEHNNIKCSSKRDSQEV